MEEINFYIGIILAKLKTSIHLKLAPEIAYHDSRCTKSLIIPRTS